MRNAVLLIVLGLLAPAALTPAQVQNLQSWVSGAGDDNNPCSRTAPCQSFAGALNKTTTGGQITCLDSAGFGAVTITRSITIRCDGERSGHTSANGLLVNSLQITGTSASDIVTLRGPDLD